VGSEDLVTLTERLVAHPKWIQAQVHDELVGVITVACPRGRRWTRAHGRWVQVCGPILRTKQSASMLPDIDHPATRGVLLAWLQHELGTWVACYRIPHAPWVVADCETGRTITVSVFGPGNAIVTALLNEWDKPEGAAR
jgi:hypothetical protein